MRKCLYILWATVAVLLAATSCQTQAARQKAAREKAHQDSIDSTRRADSVWEAQTVQMLRADTLMERYADSLRRATAAAGRLARSSKLAFVRRVMTTYVATLNKGASVSSALGQDASNKVVAALSAATGGPSTTAPDSTGKAIRYALVGVTDARQDWYTCTWRKGNRTLSKTVKVGINIDRFRLDDVR